MDSHKKRFALLLAGLVVSLASCSSQPEPTPPVSSSAPPVSSSPSPSATASPTPSKTDEATAKTSTKVAKTLPATIYKVDNQCEKLVPEEVPVAANQPIESAVSQVLSEQNMTDFDLSGYRVNVKDGVATVDLRLNPDSKRHFESLSSCEQLALFGSIQKTLTSNAQWKINSVRFTEQGEEIVL
jgi:PBP1b-binding outer membrane lipoprotein LpoB